MLSMVVCISAFALTVEQGQRNFTVSNISVGTPLSTDTAEMSTAYRISANQSNTGTLYVGNSTVSASSYADYLNAGDTRTKDTYGKSYRLNKVYVIGTVLNDTYSVDLDIP